MDGGKWQGKTSRTISFLILRESMMDDMTDECHNPVAVQHGRDLHSSQQTGGHMHNKHNKHS